MHSDESMEASNAYPNLAKFVVDLQNLWLDTTIHEFAPIPEGVEKGKAWGVSIVATYGLTQICLDEIQAEFDVFLADDEINHEAIIQGWGAP